MTQRSSSRPPLSHRARAELTRAGEIRFDGLRGAAIGVLAAATAVAAKLVLNELAGGDTGYILLVAAVIVAAWIGGVPGGITATSVGVTLNSVIFITDGRLAAATPLEAWRQALFIVIGIAASVLLASRRSSRDRLAAALVEVSNLADEVDSRDRRLEIMLAASGTGFWEWDITTGKLSWSDAIFEQHGLDPGGDAPDFPTYLGMIREGDREQFTSAIEAAVAGVSDLDIEFRLVWADGSEHWTHGAGRVFRDAHGRPIRMIGTGQDITDRKHLEADRDRLLADERRAASSARRSSTSSVTRLRYPDHDDPRARPRSCPPGPRPDPEVRAAMVADTRAESERLYRLVEDLLVLSRVERGAARRRGGAA